MSLWYWETVPSGDMRFTVVERTPAPGEDAWITSNVSERTVEYFVPKLIAMFALPAVALGLFTVTLLVTGFNFVRQPTTKVGWVASLFSGLFITVPPFHGALLDSMLLRTTSSAIANAAAAQIDFFPRAFLMSFGFAFIWLSVLPFPDKPTGWLFTNPLWNRWAKDDPDIWRRVVRLQRYGMAVTGLLLAIGAFFQSHWAIIAVIGLGPLLMTLATWIYSWRLAKARRTV